MKKVVKVVLIAIGLVLVFGLGWRLADYVCHRRWSERSESRYYIKDNNIVEYYESWDTDMYGSQWNITYHEIVHDNDPVNY